MKLLPALLFQPKRKIGYLVPDVVISENHTDTLMLTSHPVEACTDCPGNISDHAWMEPATLTMEIAFSDGGSLLDIWDTRQIGLGVGSNGRESYKKLLELQKSRSLLEVVTGKRSYSNMLISKISVTTNVNSENALRATLTLTEVIISNTRVIPAASKADMQQGVGTSELHNSGKKVTKPVSTTVDLSWLKGAT